MDKIYVIYWSQSGNTQAMAEAVSGGKQVALFGSYGWGNGSWMRDWADRMSGCGATVLNGEGLICQETPDEAALAECEALGKQLAAI